MLVHGFSIEPFFFLVSQYLPYLTQIKNTKKKILSFGELFG